MDAVHQKSKPERALDGKIQRRAPKFCFAGPLCNASVIINGSATQVMSAHVTFSPASSTYSWMGGEGMDAPGLQMSAISSQQSSNS